jgi:hypothetical protein
MKFEVGSMKRKGIEPRSAREFTLNLIGVKDDSIGELGNSDICGLVF